MNSPCNSLPFRYESEELPKFLKDVIQTRIEGDTPSNETFENRVRWLTGSDAIFEHASRSLKIVRPAKH